MSHVSEINIIVSEMFLFLCLFYFIYLFVFSVNFFRLGKVCIFQSLEGILIISWLKLANVMSISECGVYS